MKLAWPYLLGLITACASLVVAVLKALKARSGLRNFHLGRTYDIFISYRSKNVTTARQIAERLIAAEVRAWFSEYELPLKKQLQIMNAPHGVRETLISKAIRQGVKRSRYGLALTNDSFAESPYCEVEIRQLLSRCGPERTFELMIPQEPKSHQRFETLSACPSFVFQGEVDDVITFLTEKTGWRAAPAKTAPVKSQISPPPPHIYRGNCLGRPYELCTQGWNVSDSASTPLDAAYERGPELLRVLDNGGTFAMNLYCGKEVDQSVIRKRLNKEQDDRKVYEALRQHMLLFAQKHYLDLRIAQPSVHLIFHSDFPQLALSYVLRGISMRKYSVMLMNPMTNDVAEFVFTFGIYPAGFREFCGNAYLMDDLVLSLKWT